MTAIDDVSVSKVRRKLGMELANLDNGALAHAFVVPVPDSARLAAKGYASVSGKYKEAITKKVNGRTFIEAEDRKRKVYEKYDISPRMIRGKDIVLVDDSVVRGTTMQGLAERLRNEAGARSIHLRLVCPPILSPCPYGIDISSSDELAARKVHNSTLWHGTLSQHELNELATLLGVDSIKYVPVETIPKVLEMERDDLCMACVDGNYPTPAGQKLYQISSPLPPKSMSAQVVLPVADSETGSGIYPAERTADLEAAVPV